MWMGKEIYFCLNSMNHILMMYDYLMVALNMPREFSNSTLTHNFVAYHWVNEPMVHIN